MKPDKVYKFCPRCSSELKPENKNLLTCKTCKFRFYINPSPCNAVVIENDNKEILLVKRKFEPMKGYWDLPGGFIDPDENLEKSVRREVQEELGISVEMQKIIGVYSDRYLYQGVETPVITIGVFGKIISGDIKASDDVSGFNFFKKDDILNQKIGFKSVKNTIQGYLESKK